MQKILLILGLFLWTQTATALDISEAELKRYDGDINQCGEFIDPDESLPADDYFTRINYAERVQECYTNLAVKIFEKYYRKTPEATLRDMHALRDMLRQRYNEANERSIFCKPTCGTKEALHTARDVTYGMETYLRSVVDALRRRKSAE